MLCGRSIVPTNHFEVSVRIIKNVRKHSVIGLNPERGVLKQLKWPKIALLAEILAEISAQQSDLLNDSVRNKKLKHNDFNII